MTIDYEKASKAFNDELDFTIKKRKKYEGWDFKISHIFIWVSILASFSSSILIAIGYEAIYKILISVLAGIPGLVVVIDKTFDFTRRAAWGTMYKIDLEELKDKVDFGKIESYEATKELRELNKKHESSFLRIGFFAKDKDGNLKEYIKSDRNEQTV